VTVAWVVRFGNWAPDEEGYHHGPDEEESDVVHQKRREMA
jgi:hypothetical protein